MEVMISWWSSYSICDLIKSADLGHPQWSLYQVFLVLFFCKKYFFCKKKFNCKKKCAWKFILTKTLKKILLSIIVNSCGVGGVYYKKKFKEFFYEKNIFFKKKYFLQKKNIFYKKKILWKKNIFYEKKYCLRKNIFYAKKIYEK